MLLHALLLSASVVTFDTAAPIGFSEPSWPDSTTARHFVSPAIGLPAPPRPSLRPLPPVGSVGVSAPERPVAQPVIPAPHAVPSMGPTREHHPAAPPTGGFDDAMGGHFHEYDGYVGPPSASWWNDWWRPGCDMVQHHSYMPQWQGYYYFRAQHIVHLRQQQDAVAQWGGNPLNVCDNRFLDRLQAEYIEQAASRHTGASTVPAGPQVAPALELLAPPGTGGPETIPVPQLPPNQEARANTSSRR